MQLLLHGSLSEVYHLATVHSYLVQVLLLSQAKITFLYLLLTSLLASFLVMSSSQRHIDFSEMAL